MENRKDLILETGLRQLMHAIPKDIAFPYMLIAFILKGLLLTQQTVKMY